MSVLVACANTVKAVLNKQSMYFLSTLRSFFSWQTRHTVRHWKISNENKFLLDFFFRTRAREQSNERSRARLKTESETEESLSRSSRVLDPDAVSALRKSDFENKKPAGCFAVYV